MARGLFGKALLVYLASAGSLAYAKENEPRAPVIAPKTIDDAIGMMFSYEIDGNLVIDRGRDKANDFLSHEPLGANELESAFSKIREISGKVIESWEKTLAAPEDRGYTRRLAGRVEFENDCIGSFAKRFSYEKSAQKRYRLMDLVDRTESLEETVKRLEAMKKTNLMDFNTYRKAIINLDLVTIPGGTQFYFGTATLKEVEDMTKDCKSDVIDQEKTQILGNGWKARNETVLVGRFEMTENPIDQKSKAINGLSYYEFIKKAKMIAEKEGIDPENTGIIDEETYEQAMRGTQNRRKYTSGNIAKPEWFNLRIMAKEDPYMTEADYLKSKELWNGFSPYGLIAGSCNYDEIVQGTFRRPMNATPTEEEKEIWKWMESSSRAGTLFQRAVSKGSFALRIPEDAPKEAMEGKPIEYAAAISRRTVANFDKADSANGRSTDTSRIMIKFPKK